METTEFVDKLAEYFEKFMTEAQLSSAVSMVIVDNVLPQGNVEPAVVQASIATLIRELQGLHDELNSSSPSQASDDVPCRNCREKSEVKGRKPDTAVDPSVVQITVDNKEIDRRIRAFIERKQVEKDDTNCREFCSSVPRASENSCARTDAVFTSKMGGKSHVKVSKVINTHGPQTRPAFVSKSHGRSAFKRARSSPDSSLNMSSNTLAGVEERLRNMESYLKLKSGHSSGSDVFHRLKELEDRILQLESISPEYCNIASSVSKHQRFDHQPGKAPGRDNIVQDIDNRIKELQHSLRMKTAEIERKSENAPI